MKAARLPVELSPGEVLLQWCHPRLLHRLVLAARAARGWMLLGGLMGAGLLVCTTWGLGWLHPALGPVGFGIGVVLTLLGWVVPFVGSLVMRPAFPWWVTSRRLVIGGTARPRIVALAALDDVELGPAWVVTAVVGGERVRLRPVYAASELWGALLLGRALAEEAFPPVDADAPAPTVGDVVCWNGEGRAGTTRSLGVLVLRKDRVAWVPSQATTLAGRLVSFAGVLAGGAVGLNVRTLRPDPPIQPLLYRLVRVATPGDFDLAIATLARAWGGFVVGTDGVEVSSRAAGDDVSVAVGGGRYRAPRVRHPAWPAIRQAWAAVDRRAPLPPSRVGTSLHAPAAGP
jgi:hypothetical protein